jgi:hypothetical protein
MDLPDFGPSGWSVWTGLGRLLAVVAMVFGVALCAGSVWLFFWALTY